MANREDPCPPGVYILHAEGNKERQQVISDSSKWCKDLKGGYGVEMSRLGHGVAAPIGWSGRLPGGGDIRMDLSKVRNSQPCKDPGEGYFEHKTH